MAQVINTNMASLNTQRHLNSTKSALQTSLERISSGLRINSAKDDAAGLAISQRFTAQIRGLQQAVKNANDGISLAQTAEGALGEIAEALQRMRELSVQTANATNSSSDRKAVNTEVQQLIAEVDRIAVQTGFNNAKILSQTGGFNASFQVGANVSETIDMSIRSVRSSELGMSTNYDAISSLPADQFSNRLRTQFSSGFSDNSTINGTKLGSISANSNSMDKINAINKVSGQTGISAVSYGNSLVSLNAADDDADSVALGNGDIVINGVAVGAVTDNTQNSLVDQINAISSRTGVTASAGIQGTSSLVLSNTTGQAVNITVNSANAATRSGFAVGSTTMAAGDNGAIVLNSSLSGTTVAFDDLTTLNAITGESATSPTMSLEATRLSNIDVSTIEGSNLAILAIDNALNIVSRTQSDLGAVQNRLGAATKNINSTTENLSAARSRILDTDLAAETAELTRGRIMQQAGMSILAQANASTQSVLTLLQ